MLECLGEETTKNASNFAWSKVHKKKIFSYIVLIKWMTHIIKMKRMIRNVFAFAIGIVLVSCGNKNDNGNDTIENSLNQRDTLSSSNEKVPQTLEERIADIRSWYEQAENLPKSNCSVKTKKTFDSLGPDSEPMEFQQKVSVCQISDDFELIEADFSGWESGSTAHIYKKEGKIFFVFVEGGAEGWRFERRYYCDQDENVIRFLEREADGGDEPNGPQITKKLNPAKPSIRDYISYEIDEIKKVLKTAI